MLELLIEAPDQEAREVLVVFGHPLLDYSFFQGLTSRIDAAADAKEKERLTAIRAEVLEIRDRLDEEARAVLEERATLLRDLMVSSAPENLARRRMGELDRAFLTVLTSQLEEAQQAENEEAVNALQGVYDLVLRLAEETLPPPIRLLNRLMSAEDDETIDKLLEGNRPLITDKFVELVDQMVSSVQEDEEVPPEAVERLRRILPKAKSMVGNGGD